MLWFVLCCFGGERKNWKDRRQKTEKELRTERNSALSPPLERVMRAGLSREGTMQTIREARARKETPTSAKIDKAGWTLKEKLRTRVKASETAAQSVGGELGSYSVSSFTRSAEGIIMHPRQSRKTMSIAAALRYKQIHVSHMHRAGVAKAQSWALAAWDGGIGEPGSRMVGMEGGNGQICRVWSLFVCPVTGGEVAVLGCTEYAQERETVEAWESVLTSSSARGNGLLVLALLGRGQGGRG